MGLPIQPAAGPAPLPAPSLNAGAAAQTLASAAPSSVRALVTSGGTSSPGSSDAHSGKSNSTSQDARGGASAAIARHSLDLPEFPAPPISDLDIPVALIDLPRLGSSTTSAPPPPPKEEAEPVESAEAERPKPEETGTVSQHRVQDETLSDTMTPPPEARMVQDVAQVRVMEAKAEQTSVDVAR